MPLPDFLAEGYRQFRSSAFLQSEDRYRKLAIEGQQPGALVIACCDSRSAPEAIFNCGPGEVFVVRNVANIVPPYEPDTHLHGTSAAIEYAVDVTRLVYSTKPSNGRGVGIRVGASSAHRSAMVPPIRP